ncbi:hypothetical protein SAMN05421823_109146 [Catalinimonas alkaloidigena]|uniref:Uncharacterized protein n=1 Tax=Catalinimonas alkaloidigena TaxID=1075417 RepID=A0A1G9PBU4_9BACT|nr:hypothetical protein [Catalinimonas alkaloidigena]SDL96286.1 hypothetical protein SAMN05421823_109146 [Catalinimonas alkaloidigena]
MSNYIEIADDTVVSSLYVSAIALAYEMINWWAAHQARGQKLKLMWIGHLGCVAYLLGALLTLVFPFPSDTVSTLAVVTSGVMRMSGIGLIIVGYIRLLQMVRTLG